MAQQKKRGPGRPPGSKNKNTATQPKTKEERVKEYQLQDAKDRRQIDVIWSVTLIALGVFLLFTVIFDTTGAFGMAIHDVCLGLFGIMAYILPFLFVLAGILLIAKKLQHIGGRTAIFSAVIFFTLCMINSYRFIDESKLAYGFADIADYYNMGVAGEQGGVIGMELGSLIVKGFGKPGLLIFSIALLIISFILVVNTRLSERVSNWRKDKEAKKIMKSMEEQEATAPETKMTAKDSIPPTGRNIYGGRSVDLKDTIVERKTAKIEIPEDPGKYDNENIGMGAESKVSKSGYGLDGETDTNSGGKPNRVIKTADLSSKGLDEDEKDLVEALEKSSDDGSYELPAVSLLKKGSSNKQMMTDLQLEQRADLLEKTLKDFGVDATVLTVTQGASVTRYEIQPATGVKVSSITRLENDIALNLRAKSLRIEAPIPGKAAVGIEVENENPAPVLVRDLIETPEFIKSESKISFVVGKDISGKNIVSDLKSMPHLLIAGATGSGKSVCINAIIASFLFKAKPSELKLIMIDPKVVELQHYNGIPHMLTPVVTDARKASRALAIAVQEMDKRYELFAKYGVKDLDSYNEYMIADNEPQNCKPQVVIIIDELADLMMAAPSEVENSICRLAQKARAAGMHLIVATQRPSVDVVTGLIKANIPSRIAFSVSSQFDSRTILDTAGAEKLLGKGDMLYSPVGSNKPYRVQGPYISDAEIDKLIKFVKKQGGDPVYDEELKNAIESNDASKKPDSEDELTEDAIAYILKSKQASVSMLQRRFRIGYNRAARIIDEIEERGIIGPSDGSRPRQVLVTEDEYYNVGSEEETLEDIVDEEI